jgi:glutathione S-transferase
MSVLGALRATARRMATARRVGVGVAAVGGFAASSCETISFARCDEESAVAAAAAFGGLAAGAAVGYMAAAPASASPIKAYYTMTGAPNPQIVDLAAAELGVDLKEVTVEVDLVGLKNRTDPEQVKLNPTGGLPFVELWSGLVVSETMAICELMDDGTLMGRTPEEQATTRMWHRRVEQQICLPIMNSFRWGAAKDFFKARGPHGMLGNDDAAKQQLAVAQNQLKWLDEQMSTTDNTWICGDRYSMADVTLFAMLWFFCVTPGFGPPYPELLEATDIPWIKAWYARVAARPASKACEPGA